MPVLIFVCTEALIELVRCSIGEGLFGSKDLQSTKTKTFAIAALAISSQISPFASGLPRLDFETSATLHMFLMGTCPNESRLRVNLFSPL